MGAFAIMLVNAVSVPAVSATPGPSQGLMALQDALSGAIASGRSSVVAIRARHLSPGQGQVESAGAGIFIDPRGIIITNYHLVGNAHEVEVEVWQTGSPRYYAWVMAADPERDMALLAVWGTGPFPTATLASSAQVQVGDRVVAIGTPLGLPHSASTGIVSGLHLNLRVGTQSYPDMIQTDATINQGNSGGALLNLRGELIGVVTAIFAPQGSSTGVAFAIPSNRVRDFAQRMRVTTGARLTAFESEPIRIGQRRPHAFGVCTSCHSITQKLAISMAQKMPHPDAGDCLGCHNITDMAQAGAATAAAWQLPLGGGLAPAGTTARSPVGWTWLVAGVVLALCLGLFLLTRLAVYGGRS